MRFFGETKIDFINKRRIAFIISALFIITGIVSLIINGGPKYSIDFTGGVSLELDLSPVTENAEVIDIQEIRDVLSQNNFVCDACGYIYNPAKNNNVAFDYLPEDWVCPVCGVGKDMFNPVDIKGAEIQEIRDLEGRTLILIKTKAVGDTKEKVSTQIVEIIKKNFPDNVNPETLIRLQEEVGPKIGEELKGKAILAIFWALLGIIIYIWWRFEFAFGVTAVIALFHDIIITVGIFSFVGKEISLPIVAALLTIVGYSLNDTIVVFDRIREDLKIYRKESYGSVINHSINETLSRTIITSLTTFVVVLSLYVFGGTVIHDFAFAILIGVVVGTYSSIFVASPLMVEHFNKRQKKLGSKGTRKK